jgi:membrane protease YdiL (CAAX protease family)
MKRDFSKAKIWAAAEILVLLLLPLPFFKLNVIYLVAALGITLSSKFIRKETWSDVGFLKVATKRLLLAAAIGLVYGVVDNFLIEPVITRIVGAEPDLSAYEGIKGSFSGLILVLFLGWFVGGLFEEYFYRGYLFNRMRILISNPTLYKSATILITSVVFAFAHNYQGIGGITGTFLFSIVMGLLYFGLAKNVWYLVLIHGFYDTVGIFRLYLGA